MDGQKSKPVLYWCELTQFCLYYKPLTSNNLQPFQWSAPLTVLFLIGYTGLITCFAFHYHEC
jgi:hypothetical protein